MGRCDYCGEQTLTFTCSYCGGEFCSDHRLPENHDCEGLDEEASDNDSWFQEKDVKNRVSTRQVKHSFWSDALQSLKGNFVLATIAVTSIAFVLEFTLPRGLFFDPFVLDPSFEALASKPWSLLTLVLLHGGFTHLFVNMVTLFFVGKPVERIVNAKEFFSIYLGGALAASLGYVAFYHLQSAVGSPEISLALGASGAVVTVFGVFARLYPEAQVLLFFVAPMKVRTATYAFAALEATNMAAKLAGITIPLLSQTASSAHLTGLLVGLWIGGRLKKRVPTRRGLMQPF